MPRPKKTTEKSEEKPDAWKSGEDAPKDGRQIIGELGGWVRMCAWSEKEGKWCVSELMTRGEGREKQVWYEGGLSEEEPTRWREV